MRKLWLFVLLGLGGIAVWQFPATSFPTHPLLGKEVLAVTVDPARPDVILAGTRQAGAWYSPEGDGSFSSALRTEAQSGRGNLRLSRFAWHPGETGLVAAIADRAFLAISSNSGQTWTSVAGFHRVLFDLAWDSSGTYLYAATQTGLLRFNPLTRQSTFFHQGIPIKALAADPAEPGHILAATLANRGRDASMLLETNDGGTTWSKSRWERGISRIAIVEPGTFLVTLAASGYGSGAIAYRAPNSETWNSIPLPGGLTALHALSVLNNGDLYAAGPEGVYQCCDRETQSWNRLGALDVGQARSLAVDQLNRRVYVGTDSGLQTVAF